MSPNCPYYSYDLGQRREYILMSTDLRLEKVKPSKQINDIMSRRELLHQPGGDFVDSWESSPLPLHINELNFIVILDWGISPHLP